jgi:hypothetical protein
LVVDVFGTICFFLWIGVRHIEDEEKKKVGSEEKLLGGPTHVAR